MNIQTTQKQDSSTNNKVIFILLSSIILISPIPFGSVHSSTFAIWTTIISGIWLTQAKFPTANAVLPLLKSLAVLLAFGLFGAVLHLIFSPTFPVSDIYSFSLEPERFVSFISTLLSLALLISLTSKLNHSEFNKLYTVGLISGLIVATIGLMHWLSDNGKLFWIFEPSFVFETNRARWPFVNSNHLGAFLIIPFFICLARLVTNIKIMNTSLAASLFKTYMSAAARILKIKNFPTTVAYGVSLIWIGIAITATLSRAVVSSVVVLAVITVAMDATIHSKRSKSFIYWGFGLIILIAALILVDQSELIEARLYYSLLASKDDLRWQMYKESLPLISLFGVGLGGWERSFFKIASPTFVGLNPKYLHSDILQFVIEAGLISFFIIVFLLRRILKELFWSLFNNSSKYYTAGIIGVLAASCFDFPLRMPSILWTFSIFLIVWILNFSLIEGKRDHI